MVALLSILKHVLEYIESVCEGFCPYSASSKEGGMTEGHLLMIAAVRPGLLLLNFRTSILAETFSLCQMQMMVDI